MGYIGIGRGGKKVLAKTEALPELLCIKVGLPWSSGNLSEGMRVALPSPGGSLRYLLAVQMSLSVSSSK